MSDSPRWNPTPAWTPAGLLLPALVFACALVGGPALAADTGVEDCPKNHFILNDPVDCWQKTAALHVARLGHTATRLLDGRVLVAGGDDGRQGASVEIYDPSTGSWTLAAPLHVARIGHVAARLADGRVMVLGGHDTYTPQTHTYVIENSAEIYDPAVDAWTVVSGPLTPRDYPSLTLLNDGKLLIAGGLDAADQAVSTSELFDPSTGQWMQTGSFWNPGPHAYPVVWKRWGHTATLMADGRVLVTGGFPEEWIMETLAQAQVYDPATGLWSDAGDMTERRGRGYHAATLLADGRVLVTGGDWRTCMGGGCGEFTLGSSEIYDPRANAWSAGPDLQTPRNSHTATRLDDGSVLLVGGARDVSGIPYFHSIVIGDVETSAPSAAPFGAATSMVTPRSGHTATLLLDGAVLVVGGSNDSSPGALNTAEIYRPPRGSAR
jgi:hypothetical protein